MRTKRRWSLLLVSALSLLASRAQAGGFYLLPRGARGVALGGAVVAGSDDPGALWYNPAGLSYSGRQLLADFVLPIQRIDYQRVRVGGVAEPETTARSAPYPVPGFAYSDNFGLRRVTFGLGLFVPPASLMRWPKTVHDAQGRTLSAPQRYSIKSMEGSALGMLTAGVSVRATRWLSLGGAFWLVGGRFVADVTLSACDQAFACQQPEAADWDAQAKVVVDRIVRPTGSFGAIVDVAPLRVGASFMLPFALAGDARFGATLPRNDVFTGATLVGDKAHLDAPFPWILRTGVELRASARVRLELAYHLEAWSRQRVMHIEPRGVFIEHVIGIEQPYPAGPVDFPRYMKNTHELGLGAEVRARRADALTILAGLFGETSSFDDAYFTALTPDTDKLGASLGASYDLTDAIALDAVGGYLFLRTRNVTHSKVVQPSALRPPAADGPDCAATYEPGCPVPIANGRYAQRAGYVGIGVRVRFAAAAQASR